MSKDPSAFHLALYGGVGVAGWLILVYGLPLARQAIDKKVKWTPSLQGVLGLVGFILFNILLGMVAPFIADAHAFKTAVIAGLGWQGIFGQYAKPSA